MMKKITLLLLVVVMAATALLCSACLESSDKGNRTANGNFGLYYSTEGHVENAPTTAVKLPESIDEPYECRAGELAFFFREGDKETGVKASLAVYDLINGDVLFEEQAPITDYEALEYMALENCFAVRRGSVCTLYDRNRREVDSFEGASSLADEVRCSANMVFFNEHVYCFDKTGEVVKENSFDAHTGYHMPDVDFQGGDYYYAFSDDGKALQIYDKKLVPYAYYELPAYAYAGKIFQADEESFIMQYTVKEADDATGYTYLTAEGKFTLKTFVLDVAKNKLTEKKCDYLLEEYNYIDSDAEQVLMQNGYKKNSIHAAAYAAQIVEKRLEKKELYYLFTMLSFDKASQSVFDVSCDMPYFSGKNYIFSAEDFDCLYLTDEQGNLLSTVQSSMLENAAFVTPSYIVMGTTIYDYAFNTVFELTQSQIEDGMVPYKAMGDVIYFADSEGTICRLKMDGKKPTFKRIASADDVIDCEFDGDLMCYYLAEDASGDGSVTYYNAEDEIIVKNLSSALEEITRLDGRTLMYTYDENGDYVYYLFVQEPIEKEAKS